mmetsp:Transcript_63062/g.126501  ORF Transcript_63062/g.126501 Transcript_63062/m.126501 type:complete len:389 (-) Transcript_63062:100-1266(-)
MYFNTYLIAVGIFKIARGGGSHYTTQYKLELDLEQARFIAQGGCGADCDDKAAASSDASLPSLPPLSSAIPLATRAHFTSVVVPTYEKVLSKMPPLHSLSASGGLYAFDTVDKAVHGIGKVYNRALHTQSFNELSPPEAYFGKGGLDVKGVTDRWHASEPSKVVVIDDVLSPTALREVRKLLAESTVFYQTKLPLKFGGYSGAYIDDGLHQRLLLGLAFALHRQLPDIFRNPDTLESHDLRYMWAYKYAPGHTGINVHADEAAVNVNLWVTEDDANLDNKSGGLVVFTAKPPLGWDFERYNTDTEKVVEEVLRPTGFANVTVPHRANRAVIFDSMLFHHTDKYNFTADGGPLKRRINLTLLYGTKQPISPVCTTPFKSTIETPGQGSR